jgi:hypothetical protein
MTQIPTVPGNKWRMFLMNCTGHERHGLDSFLLKMIILVQDYQNNHAQQYANPIDTQVPKFLTAVFQERKEGEVRLLALVVGQRLPLLLALNVPDE